MWKKIGLNHVQLAWAYGAHRAARSLLEDITLVVLKVKEQPSVIDHHWHPVPRRKFSSIGGYGRVYFYNDPRVVILIDRSFRKKSAESTHGLGCSEDLRTKLK